MTGPSTIDRSSPVPFYFQLAGLIQEEIATGRLAPGAQLPEPELGDHFGVSRSVTRQALDRLERDGNVRRVKGRGTFVVGVAGGSWRLQSSEGFFQEEVARLGHRVTSKILRAETGPLPRWATAALELPDGAEGVTIERLRFVDAQIALYNVNHAPAALAETALSLQPGDSLYERIERDHGIGVHGARRVAEAVPAEARMAKLLDVGRATPLILIESVSWDEQLCPFDCYQTWLRPDRARIEVQVAKESG